MSNIYITEPPTDGKVLLHTTVGDIDIELWSKETPKTCRNFVQLCMEGYYNGTIFHRVVPDFIVQGGDPTGTGEGGESIYGKPFKDELHSRLRFARRGLVAMANAGPNDNGSQFFFTLGPTPELNKKHTIFGKVVGDTLYNMLKLSEVDIGPDERPTYPPVINKSKVLSNPFSDIVPRATKREDKPADEKKKKTKGTKNFSLLSFGEEAEEEEVLVKKVNKSMKSKSKSSHDLLDDSKLSKDPAVESKEYDKEERKKKRKEENLPELTDSSEEEENIEATKQRIRNKLHKSKEETINKAPKRKEPEPNPDDSGEEDATKSKTLEELKKEAKKLKREILASRRKEKEPEKEEKKEEVVVPTEVDDGLHMQAFEANRQLYKNKQKKMKRGTDREAQTLALLAKFQSKVNTAKQFAEYGEKEEEEKEDKEEGEEDKSDDEDGNDLSWVNHKLSCEAQEKKVIDANITDNDRYEIFDPRNPMSQRRREASKQAMKEMGKRDDKL